MPRARNPSRDRLAEAIALLLRCQAAFLARTVAADRELGETRRRSDEILRRIDERFDRIEALLLENLRLAQALPDRVREKLGIKIAPQP